MGHSINKLSTLFLKLIMKITLILVIYILINVSSQVSWATTIKEGDKGKKTILTLRECLQLAIKNSSELDMDKNKLMIGKLRLEDAETYKKWPKMDVSMGWIYTDKSEAVADPDTIVGTASISHNVFDFFTNAERMWESSTGLTQIEIEMEQKRIGLYLAVGEAYFNLLLTHKQFKLEEVNLKQKIRNVHQVEILHQNGIASEFEVTQAQTEFSRAKINIEIKKQALQLAEMALAKTIGIPLDKRIQVSEVYSAKPFLLDWNQTKAYSLNHRREFILQKKLLEQIPDYLRLIKRAKWPTLSANLFFGDKFENIEFDENANAGIGLVISKTIFDGGITKRKMQQTKINLQVTKDSILNFKKTYLDNLKILYVKSDNSKALIQKTKTQQDLELKIANMYQKRYELRAVSLKDLIDSQDMVKRFENDYSSALIAHMKLTYILKIFIGMDPFTEGFF